VNLRQAAALHECTLRLDGCNTEPCCLAHYRVIGVSGMGIKPPDVCAAIACFNCHEAVDKRRWVNGRPMTQDEIDAAFARGMARTLKIWTDENRIEVAA
jgi:hypothetical protein